MAYTSVLVYNMDSEEISKSNGEENAPIVETESHDVSGNSVTEPEIQKDPDGNADNNNEHEKLSPRKWRGPPKNSDRYGIRHSLQKMAVKYAPPKVWFCLLNWAFLLLLAFSLLGEYTNITYCIKVFFFKFADRI